MSDAVIALAVGFFIILVVLPIVAFLLFTLLDIVARIDIGWSKVVWLPLVLFVPVGGLLLYWLTRPKDFNPWEYDEPMRFPVTPNALAQPAYEPVPRQAERVAAFVPSRTAVALQGGADPDEDTSVPPVDP